MGKRISQKFYKKRHSNSYYFGCPTSGRPGFKPVHAFQDDFDGIVAGAHPFAFNSLSLWSGTFHIHTGISLQSS